MKLRLTFFMVFFIGFLITAHTELVFSQQSGTCQPHSVCAHTGDLLRYSVSLGSTNSSQTYNFEDMVDENHIMAVERNTINDNKIQNNTLNLNLKTGFVGSEHNTSAQKPFLAILPTPIDYNKTDPSITHEITDFNGFKRTTLVAFQSGVNSTSKMEYDMETGILLEAHSISIVTILGKPQLVDFSNRLVQTNMISSDSPDLMISKNTSIPNWIKSDAKWWSEDQIEDHEFIKAIQYMITNGIMQVPHGSAEIGSSQQIPNWIKHDAGWWADGQISEDEFVKSIQWLISNGIIRT